MGTINHDTKYRMELRYTKFSFFSGTSSLGRDENIKREKVYTSRLNVRLRGASEENQAKKATQPKMIYGAGWGHRELLGLECCGGLIY